MCFESSQHLSSMKVFQDRIYFVLQAT